MHHANSHLISYSSPLLQMLDTTPLKAAPDFVLLHQQLQNQLRREGGAGIHFRYGFFSTNQCGLGQLSDLMVKNRILPKISKCYQFDQVPEAYDDMLNNRHFGKVVVQV